MEELVKRFELILKVGGNDYFPLEDYQSLVEYYKDKDFSDHALKVCLHALEKHLFSYELYIEGIYLSLELEDYLEAQNILDKAMNVFPHDLEFMLLQATVFIANQKAKKAKKVLNHLAVKYPKSDSIHLMLGAVYFRFYEKYDIAEKHFLECISLNSNNPHVYDDLVDLYYETKDIKAGILYFDSLTDKFTTNADIWFNLGMLYIYNGQNKDAKAALENAHCLDEKNSDISLEIGHVCKNMGNYLEAISHYERINVEKKDLTARNAFYQIGQCYDKLGSNLAITYYKKSLDIDALHLDSLFALGNCYFNNKNWFLASKFFEKCTFLDDENAIYWFAFARTQKAMGNFISSIEMFEKATSFDEENSKIWCEWGLLYLENLQYEDGIIVLRKGIDACPLDSKLYYLLAFCLIKNGNYQEGFIELQVGLSLNFENHTIMLNFIDSEELKISLFKIFEKYKNEQ